MSYNRLHIDRILRFSISSSTIRNFFGVDLRSLATLRVGVALILIVDIVQRLSDIEPHLTDYGAVPRSLAIDNLTSRWLVSLHFLSGAWQIQWLLFLAAGFFAVLLLIGYKTRLATVASCILLLSLINRNPYVAQGGDMLLRLVLFWSIFLPLGARFSVDSAWSREAGVGGDHILFSAGTLAYSAQIVVMYWFSVLAKTGNEWWAEGSAVHYALNIDYMTTPVGHLLSGLPFSILQLTTWGVLAFEIAGPLLLFCPCRNGPIRTFGTFGFVALHCVFFSTMFIGIFPLVGIVSILFFLPPWFWDTFLPRWIRPAEPLKIEYSAKCISCSRMIRLIKTFLLAPATQIVEKSSERAALHENHQWIVIDAADREFSGYGGVLALARSSPYLRWLAPILRRAWFCRLADWARCKDHFSLVRWLYEGRRPNRQACALVLSIHTSILVALLTIYMVVWNFANLPNSPFKLSERARMLGNLSGLYQSWELFAPFPAKDDGWYIIPAKLKNGATVDLLHGGAAVNWQKPKHIALTIKNNRWRKFFETLRRKSFLAESYAAYLCREWNRRHHRKEAVLNLEIVYMLEWTDLNARYVEPKPMRLLKHRCEA